MRRFRDLIVAHEADLGGRDILSAGQSAIVRARRAAATPTRDDGTQVRRA
jgi:hypothetical protein